MLRAERVVKNQAFVRDVNEEIARAAAGFAAAGELATQCEFLCECARRECFARIRMTLAEYERLRSDPSSFALRPGHEIESIERQLRVTDRFVVVGKFHPESIRIAAARRQRLPPHRTGLELGWLSRTL